MTIVVLARDESALGVWQVDYDDVGLTVGHTVTSIPFPPPATRRLVLTVTEVDSTGQPTGVSFHKDVTADFGKGRVVDFSNVANSRVPPHVKGEVYPYDFDSSWTP